MFFFRSLTDNLFLRSSLDYLIVFISHTNVLLGRDGEGPCLTRVVVALTIRAQVAFIQVRGKGKAYCKKVLRWGREEL